MISDKPLLHMLLEVEHYNMLEVFNTEDVDDLGGQALMELGIISILKGRLKNRFFVTKDEKVLNDYVIGLIEKAIETNEGILRNKNLVKMLTEIKEQ